jgi:hypothetical protein
MSVDSLESFNTEKFRDRFKLSNPQASEIIQHIQKKTTPEGGLQNKFFKVKKYLEEALFTEMDVSNSNQKIMVDYPDGDTWACTELVCSGSGAGKTWFLKEKVKRCLDGKAKNRRDFLWVSNEYLIDSTIDELKKPKYIDNFQGIDISDSAINQSTETQGPQEYFDKIVKPAIDQMPPRSVIIVDDSMDSPIRKQMLFMINRLLRTGRHTKRGLAYILHRIKSGLASQQASSSCRYYVLFPRSQKGKIIDFLSDLGFTRKEARQQVADFADSRSRHLIVRLHSPTALINEELLRLF